MAIVLFTDFGSGDLYVGQMKAVLQRLAPPIAVIDLLHDAPAFNVRASAHLLAALVGHFAEDSVFLTVVDPGVGGARDAVGVQADGRLYVGPDNRLLSAVGARAAKGIAGASWAAGRAVGLVPRTRPVCPGGRDAGRAGRLPRTGSSTRHAGCGFGGDDLPEIIYVDHYGNAHTGIRARGIPREALLAAGERRMKYARVYSEVTEGEAFWYENSQGLVEIAVNRGNAARSLNVKIGDRVAWA